MGLNAKANKSFGQDFVTLNEEEQKSILDQISFPH